mmetsp:Transcript_80334/g.159124  ORF Transcript_80334/g.159124 Transcript_80334/m.159124 type:complete len:172 (+) Transcript_80334:142-657(+)
MFAECCTCPSSEAGETASVSYKNFSVAADHSPQSSPGAETTETDDTVSEQGACHDYAYIARRECYGETFAVALQKTEACGILGLSTTASRVLPYGMRVRRVKPVGLISQWNKDHPDKRVAIRDIITEVNGISGSSDRMCLAIAADQTIRLTMLKYTGSDRTVSLHKASNYF